MSKLNAKDKNQQAFASQNDNSLSNGFLMLNRGNATSVHGGPAIMNMKFPTTSHGNRGGSN